MFKKKERPLTLMLEVYNEIANSSLSNLSNEQNGNLNIALQGWINLYNYSNDKLVNLNKKIENLTLTQEESYLFDEINILKSQSDDHLVRLNIKVESMKPPQPPQRTSTTSTTTCNTNTPTISDNVHKKKSSTTNTPSSLNVPTLRKPVPQLMNTTSKQKPLLKSLRGGATNSSSSPNLSSQQIPSSSSSTPSAPSSTTTNTQYFSTSPNKTQHSQMTAIQAANLIWAPSTSLSKQKSYTKQHSPSNETSLFQDFDSDLSSPTVPSSSAFTNNNNNNSRSDSRPNSPSTSNDTLTPELADEMYLSNLKNLRGQGISARSNRNNHVDENDLNKLAFAISELNSRDQQQYQKVNSSSHTHTHHHQKQVNNHLVSPYPSSKPITRNLTPSERAKLALKKSAAVKLSRRPANSPNSSSASTPTSNSSSTSSSPSQQASRLTHSRTASNPAVTAKLSKSSTTQHVIYSNNSTNLNHNGSSTTKRSTSPLKQQQQRSTSRAKVVPLNTHDNSSKDTINSESSLKDTETLDSDEEQHTHDLAIEGDEKAEDKLISTLKGVDPVAAKQILKEIVIKGDEVYWDDIAGLEIAKNSLKETVVYPFLRPDLFSGLREPARGMLLFGPPGTGKTMLARAVATESKSTFFSISASSLTSKYLGESEKLVRALFQLAKKLAPSIIFVDEIDSLLGSRSNENENESSRRIKNEFLVQWSDLTKAAAGRDQGEDLQRVLVLAATNLPWSIDEAARRRFVRRQYIPLPELETRKYQLLKLLSHQNHNLNETDMVKLIEITEGFSGSDITALAKDAAMGPLRELGEKLLLTSKSEIRPVELKDFVSSLNYIRPSVSKESLKEFENWAKIFGSSGV